MFQLRMTILALHRKKMKLKLDKLMFKMLQKPQRELDRSFRYLFPRFCLEMKKHGCNNFIHKMILLFDENLFFMIISVS